MIFVENVSKSFLLTKETQKQLVHHKQDTRQKAKSFQALKGISFSCEEGQVLGLLGPNGAGKTTTLRILAGALKPDEGKVSVNGVDLVATPHQAKKNIGFLSNHTGLYNRLTAYENIHYFAQLFGVSEKQFNLNSEALFEQLNLQDYLHRRLDTLSTGMKQKVSIARSVIHQPKVVILDEPTTGLDIMATETILNFITFLKSQGVSVIFSTHHLDEVALLADKVAIIDQGHTCFCGTIPELLAHTHATALRPAFMSLLQKDMN